VQVLSASRYQFAGPDAVSSDGTHIWVANGTGETLTELDAASGALVQVLSASRYRFDIPCAVSANGGDVWVTSCAGQSATVLAATRRPGM
jgi:DNA-binding beta-propeller fold protein YncE